MIDINITYFEFIGNMKQPHICNIVDLPVYFYLIRTKVTEITR